MNTDAQRIAFAEVCGYQWFLRRNGNDVVKDYWGPIELGHLPEDSLNNLACKGTISEVRLATLEEIAEAVRTNHFVTYAPYPSDLKEVHVYVEFLCTRWPDIVEFRSNQDLIQEQLDILSEREQIPAWLFRSELLVEAVLRAAGRWIEN